MSSLRAVLRELLGLFVDDEFLMIGALLVVAATAMLASHESAAQTTLVVGILVVLVAGIRRSVRLSKLRSNRL